MKLGWVSVLMPVIVALASAAYTVGGRAALARRGIRQDIELAGLLGPGRARTAVTLVAEDKTMLYVSRWVGPRRLGRRTHLKFAATTVLAGSIAFGASQLLTRPPSGLPLPAPLPTALASLSVLGLTVAFAVGIAWLTLTIVADNAATRTANIDAARERVGRYLALPEHGDSAGPAADQDPTRPQQG